jgi:hypothetical protein
MKNEKCNMKAFTSPTPWPPPHAGFHTFKINFCVEGENSELPFFIPGLHPRLLLLNPFGVLPIVK